MFKVICFLWLVYFSIAPVYWLPGIHLSTFLSFKTAAIVAATIVSFAYIFIGRGKIYLGFIGLAGFFLLFVLLSPALIIGTMSSAEQVVANLFYSTCVFLIFASFAINAEKIIVFMKLSSIPIIGFCVYSVLAYFEVVNNFRAPFVLGGFPVSVSGFTGLRTGWSNGIAMYIPFVMIFFFKRKNFTSLLFGAFGVAVIFSSQLVVGGRAGMLATIIGILLVVFMRRSKLLKFLIPLGLMLISIQMMPYLIEHLRLDRVASGTGLKELNHLSAGRIGSYIYALELFIKNPVIGVGIGNSDVGGHSIHNMWLKFLADAGIFFIFTFAFMIAKVIKGARRFLSDNETSFVLIAVVAQGLVSSMFEPSMILGSFQNSAIWWASFGLLSGMTLRARSEHLRKANVFVQKGIDEKN